MNTTPKTENRGCEKETWGNLLTLLDTPLFYDSSDYNSFHKWYRRKLSALKDYLSYHNLPADEKQLSTFSYYMLKAYVLYSSPKADPLLSNLHSSYSLFLNHCFKIPLMQSSTKKTYRKIIHPEDVICFFTFLKNFVPQSPLSSKTASKYKILPLSSSQKSRLNDLQYDDTQDPSENFYKLICIFFEEF